MLLLRVFFCQSLLILAAGGVPSARHRDPCRAWPGEPGWPSTEDWNGLNATIGGKLIRGAPLAQDCFDPEGNQTRCNQVKEDWTSVDIRIADPVNVNSPYWNNNSCSPFDGDGSCTLGHLASYAIEVLGPDDVIAGIRFAREKNVRLTIKNTGHDFLGRSTGAGALALWTHHLKDISFHNYSSPRYTGPAVHIGAGLQVGEIGLAAQSQGLRVVGGDCATVGVAGGFAQGGGHGHLGSQYGLGSDNALEYEVVTADGELRIASPTENEDLYWALSGGGPGNYGVVISMKLKAHKDGPVAGARITFTNQDPDTYWSAVEAWIRHLLVLNTLPGMSAIANMNNAFFSLNFITWPDATADELASALDPFLQELEQLGVKLVEKDFQTHPTYYEHWDYFATFHQDTNNTLGSRLIPRSVAEDRGKDIVSLLKGVVTESVAGLAILGGNYTHFGDGSTPPNNAVNPAWRESVLSLNFFLPLSFDASWQDISAGQGLVNKWQDQVKALAPGGGAYMNEATFDNPDWKEDYYGENYDKLLDIKKKYDPDFIFWASTAVGSDEIWQLVSDERLCLK